MSRLIFCSLLLLWACHPKKSFVTHFKGIAHTHAYQIQIGKRLSQKKQEDIRRLIQSTFEEVDAFYNHWNPHSELSFLNRLDPGEKMGLSPSLLKLIQKGQEITLLTQGLFDPTLGSFIKMWKEALIRKKLPQKGEKLTSGWHLFPLEGTSISRLSQTALLDFDGFLKGYVVDMLLQALCDKGYTNCYVEWGGDMRAQGSHPSKRPWKVKLSLFNKMVVTLSNAALATSGNAVQYLDKNGKRYCHIIHPHTKKAFGLKAVSVKAPTCLLADALATALMTFLKAKDALQFLEREKDKFKCCKVWLQAEAENASPLIWQGEAIPLQKDCY